VVMQLQIQVRVLHQKQTILYLHTSVHQSCTVEVHRSRSIYAVVPVSRISIKYCISWAGRVGVVVGAAAAPSARLEAPLLQRGWRHCKAKSLGNNQ
jgi:hypothetical protein